MLGLGQCILQAPARHRPFDGAANIGRDQFQKFERAGRGQVHEAKFDDTVGGALVFRGREHQVARAGAAQSCAHLQIVVRQIDQHQLTVRCERLPDQILALRIVGLAALLRRDAKAADAAQRAVFVARIQRADGCAGVLGNEVERGAAKARQALLPDEAFGQCALAAALPCLAFQVVGMHALLRNHLAEGV